MDTVNAHMRILLLNQFFWPELAATSQLLTDVARHLAEEGHQVTVVCGSSSYAGRDTTPPPPVEIIRVAEGAFSRGHAARLLSYATYFAAAAWHGVRIARPDVVISLTTPPLLSTVGMLVQRLRGARHYIWEMDLYPEVAVDLGMLRGTSLVARLSGGIADFTRLRADGIIALGECMRDRLAARGVPPARIRVAENWADGTLFHPLPHIPGDALRVIYPGNLGMAHETETLARAMHELAPDPVRFQFVGGGSRQGWLREATAGLRGVTFLPYCDRPALNRLFAASDAGLVTQNDRCTGSVVPSKIYCMMAAGLPFIFVGPRAATPGRVLERFGCGWRVECGNHAALAALLRMLAANPAEVRAAGARARAAFLEHYDTPAGVRRIAHIIGAHAGAVPGRLVAAERAG